MIKKLQVDFLQQVASKIGHGKILATELSHALGVSKSEAYGKANGSSLLTTTQILTLCDRYGIDFSILREQGRSSAKVSFLPFHAVPYSLQDYVQSLEDFLLKLHQAKLKKITCATNDIPIFHLFKYPELTAFKLHFWNLRKNKQTDIEFDYSRFDPTILHATKHIHQLYQEIPSAEIWANHLSLNTMEQIKYAAENKLFVQKEMGHLICEQLKATLKDIESYAINGQKKANPVSTFEWYFYGMIGTTTYLAEADGNQSAFIRFNTFNNLQEENGPLSTEVAHWLNNLIQDSTGFSKQGSLQRNRYLKKTMESCDELATLFI